MLQRILHSILFLLFLTPLAGQITFTVVDTTACTNTVSVAVAVSNFSEVSAFSYTMMWDETKLDYTSVSDFNLEHLNGSAFGAQDANTMGKLYVSWTDNDLSGKTVDDGTVIYYLNFTVLGNTGDMAQIDITDGQTPFITATGFPPTTVAHEGISGTVDFGDAVAPIITCPENLTVQSSSGNPIVVNNDISPMVMDACDPNPQVVYTSNATPPHSGNDDATGETFPIGTTTVTYTATDNAALSASCSFDVTVENNNTTTFTLSANEVVVNCIGEVSQIDITSENFIDMTTLSFTFMWDPAVVNFSSVGNFNLQFLDNNDFNLDDTLSGKLYLSWFDDDVTGENLADGETIFSIFFETVGSTGTTTDLMFQDGPTDLVAAHGFPPTEYPVVTVDGSVSIETYTGMLSGNATICEGESTDLSINISGGDAPYTIVYNDGNTDITLTDYQNNDPISVSPTANTTYSLVSVTDANGCAGSPDSNTAMVVVNDAPANATITGTTDTCPGDATDLTINFMGGTAPFTIVYIENFPGTSNTLTETSTQNSLTLTVMPTLPTSYTLSSITDANGCVTMPANQSAVVNASDDTAPVLTCPTNILQDVDAGTCGAIVTFVDATATDNCDDSVMPVLTSAIASGEEFPVGINTVTFQGNDDSNNAGFCSFTITINENELPVAMNCNPVVPPMPADAGECSAVINFTEPTATDNCGNVTTVASHNSGDAFPVGSTSVIYTFTDDADNTTTCNFTITVTENENPVITCPADITMAASATECSAIVTWNDATATDNCGNATVTNTSTFNSGDEISVGVTTITYEAEDDAGNTATCDFIITVFDETGPVFSNCPTDITVQTDAGMCTAMGNWMEPTADDNCGNIMSMTSNANSDDALPIGDSTIVYTATDMNGNTSTCSFIVTIEDGEAPMISDCPSDILNMPNDAGTCGAVVNYDTPTATDDCGTATVICSTASGEIFPVGTTIVTCTASDDSGNTATCTFNVVVEDTENPTITCPASQTIAAGMGNTTAIVDNIAPTTADNCGIDTIFYVFTGTTTGDGADDASGSTFNLGETTVTYNTTDDNGLIATCDFVITVIDDTDLILNCPNNAIAFTATDSCGATVLNIAPDASPMSEVASISYETTGATVGIGNDDASGIFYNIGETTVIYTATDNDGNMLNCSFLVTVNDTIMPVLIDCPADISINVLPNTCANSATWIAPTATDNCPNLNMTSTHNPGDEFMVGNTVVTYLAADASGNQMTCSFNVTVTDNINPTINNCPMDVAVVATGGDCFAVATWVEPTVSDNCPDATISSNNDSGDTFGLGENEVIYIASDVNGNQATCSFTVTVTDDQAPVIMDCPENITIPAEGADCSAIVTWTEPTATDNCPEVFLSGNPSSGSVFSTGTTTVNYIATDFSGNTAECTFTVTVQDDNAPEVTFCPPGMTEDAIQNECAATVTWQEPIFADDCGVTSVVASHTSGEMYPVSGPILVVYTASDAAGNTVNCEFTIEVIDNQPPIIFGLPDDIVVNNDPGQCSAIVNYVAPQGFDNCGVMGFVTTHPSGSEFPVGTTTVSYTASDAAGNITVESFTITIVDNEPPKPVCPESIEITVDGTNLIDPSDAASNINPVDCDSIAMDLAEPTVTDNCTMASFEQTAGNAFTNGTPFPIGTTLIEYTAMDANGNASTCAFNVIVNAIEFPAINLSSIFPCEGDDFIAQVGAYPNATFNWFDENSDLVSTGSALSISEVMLSNSGLYTIEMTLPTCVLTQQFQLTVFEKPEIIASANDILCTDGNQDLNLTATIQNGVTVNDWQWVFNGSVFSTEQNPTIESANENNSGQYIVSAISVNGCLATDTVNVMISNAQMMPTASAEVAGMNVETTCEGTTIDLIGQSYFGSQVEYNWSADPMAGSGLVAVNNFTTTATPTTAGTYTYTFSAVVDGCATEEAQVTVTVEAPPVLDAQVAGDLTCVDGTTPMTLMSNFNEPGVTYLWTLNNNFLADTENVTIENINPDDDNGSYKVVVTLPNGCESEAAIDIEITTQPASPNEIMGVANACLGEPVTFTGTDYGSDATYIWLLNGVSIPNSNEPIVTFTPTEIGSNTISFSATLNECNSGTVFQTLNIETAPVANLMIDGETTCLNGDTPLTLLSNSNDAATSFWLNENNIQVASTADFTIENANADDSGNYFFVAESAIGCQNIDTINVQITNGLPQIEAMLVGQPCEDGNLTLSSTEIQNAAYTWINPKGDNFSSAQSPLVALASTEFNGTYTVTATADGCSTTDSVAVEILEAPTAIDDEFPVITNAATEFNVLVNDGFDANEAMTVTVLQSTTQGTLTQVNDGTFSYTPKEGSLETDMFAYQICYDACPNTCDIAFVQLNVQFPTDNCTATTVITPNDDGINDRFVVFCLDVQDFPENELIIYGGWGDEVFRMTGYDNSWKGTYENEPLPDGTYYYIFKRDPNAEAEKGFVMIYR